MENFGKQENRGYRKAGASTRRKRSGSIVFGSSSNLPGGDVFQHDETGQIRADIQFHLSAIAVRSLYNAQF